MKLVLALLIGSLAPASHAAPARAKIPPKKKVLVILSAAKSIPVQKSDELKPTGYFLSELAGPLRALIDAGYEPVFMTPLGTPPTMDPGSNEDRYFKSPADRQKALELVKSQKGLAKPKGLSEFLPGELDRYSAIFVPGGHAPMVDLYQEFDMGTLLRHFHAEGKPTALLCHGPVALASASREAEPWPYGGYRMTVFSNEEETVAETERLGGKLYFHAEDKLRSLGGQVETGDIGVPRVVVDRELITGQNPASEPALTAALIDALKKQEERKIEEAREIP